MKGGSRRSRRRWRQRRASNWTPPIRTGAGCDPAVPRQGWRPSPAHRGLATLPSASQMRPMRSWHAQPVGSAARRLPSGAGVDAVLWGLARSQETGRGAGDARVATGGARRQRGRRARDPGQRAGPGIGRAGRCSACGPGRRRWATLGPTRNGAAAWTRRPSAAPPADERRPQRADRGQARCAAGGGQRFFAAVGAHDRPQGPEPAAAAQGFQVQRVPFPPPGES